MRLSFTTGISETDFYGRLLMLSSLQSFDRDESYKIERLRGPSQPSCGPEITNLTADGLQDLKEDIKLRRFLDRLADLCVGRRRGSDVTAVTVHLPATGRLPEYVFFSNSRSEKMIAAAKSYVEKILQAFCKVTENLCESQRREVTLRTCQEVLTSIVQFNRERIKSYLQVIIRCLRKLPKCERQDESSRRLLQKSRMIISIRKLKGVCDANNGSCELNLSTFITMNKTNIDSVLNLALDLIQRLMLERAAPQLEIFSLLETLVERGKRIEKEYLLARNDTLAICHTIQHALKRVLSFSDTVEDFAATAIKWPQLFQGVTVNFLPSMTTQPYGFENSARLETEKFLWELGFKDVASRAATKWPGLDRKLNECIPSSGAKRTVHAEIQLWVHMRSIPDSVPFRPGRPNTNEAGESYKLVIGVSKLTCKLCHWFFQEADPAHTVIRSSSLNVYHRWALPSLCPGPELPARLYNKLSHELSRILISKGKVTRTETDSDSEPNTPNPSAS